MNAIFADTGYWIALFNPRDDLHAKALTVARVTQGRLIVTSQMVLTEFLNYYASLGQPFRQQAVQVVKSLQQAGEVEIVPQTDEQFQAALTFYSQRPDKEWSLVDCASFRIMQERNLSEALAHDEHFQQAGFVLLLRS
jgi:predicted nucleic acid-binding protein